MPYQTQIEIAASYELIASFSIFSKRNMSRNLLYGDQWLKETEKVIGDKLSKDILAFEDPGCWNEYFTLLIHLWGREDEKATDFLNWVEGMQPGELFEYLSPYVQSPLLPQIGEVKNSFVDLLYRWNTKYFEKWDNSLLTKLKKDGQEKKLRNEKLSSIDFVDEVTGLWIGEEAPLDKVVLVPSIHINPIKQIYKYNKMNIIKYPVDPPIEDIEVPYQLRRMMKALSDEKRIRILQLIAKKPRSFTDIVHEIGLSKATVHQHLFVLRSAGLLSFHYYEDMYNINPAVFEKVKRDFEQHVFRG